MTYTVEVLHNETRDADGRHAAWDPLREGPRAQAGDVLVHVGSFTFEDRDGLTPEGIANVVFEAGNAPDVTPLTVLYRSWFVRSLSVGDVLSIRKDEGPACVLACEPVGWEQITRDGFRVVSARDYRVEYVAHLIGKHDSRVRTIERNIGGSVGSRVGAFVCLPEDVARGLEVERTADGFKVVDPGTGVSAPVKQDL